ncbi:MAG TPA: hypothetical protein VK254_03410 [Candidatus Bathyarchaeia archaeon]|nr:hypothetical protein [Candidatus Bathyarchaeia archaeon]
MERTDKKQHEYYVLARQCEAFKRSAQILLDPFKEWLGEKIKEIAEASFPVLLQLTFRGTHCVVTQSGTVNVEIVYYGYLKNKEEEGKGAALDKIDNFFKLVAAEKLGIPEKRINPILIIRKEY